VAPNRAVTAQLQGYHLCSAEEDRHLCAMSQCRVVEIDDVLALAVPLSQHPGRAKLRRIQRANLVGIAFNRPPSTPSGWQAGEGPRIATGVATFVKLGEARRFPGPLRAGTQDVLDRRLALAGYMNKTALHGTAEEPPVPPVKILPGARLLLLAICLPEIDLLSRPEDGALPGHHI
jgi:hypothetical protein